MENKSLIDEETKRVLIEKALESMENAYAPYSKFKVGAAVLAENGDIYTGANVENSSYPAGICAECNAVSTAAANGVRRITAIAVAGGANGKVDSFCTPCGICRQFLREFCDPRKFTVISAISVDNFKEYTLEELLPDSFGPSMLTKKFDNRNT